MIQIKCKEKNLKDCETNDARNKRRKRLEA